MKEEKLFNAITDIRDDLIEGTQKAYKKKRPIRWIAPVAAAAAAVLTVTALLRPWSHITDDPRSAYALAEAEYPKDPALKEAPAVTGSHLSDFAQGTVKELLGNSAGENQLFSPFSLYVSLCLLAECADGSSRQQILDLMNTESIEELREQANLLWRAHYENDEEAILIPANSLWLDQDISVDQSIMNRLATNYYASSYQGSLTDPGFLQEMKSWISRETGGLLREATEGLELAENTLLSIISTLRYSAQWQKEFRNEDTAPGIFHSPEGEIECNFMAQTQNDQEYYIGEGFQAIGKELYKGGTLYFILPDENVAPEQLAQNAEVMALVSGNTSELTSEKATIHLKVPKFDLTAETDPGEALKALGITDVFNRKTASFSGLHYHNNSDLYLKRIQQNTRLKIDEKGCEGASLTKIDLATDSDTGDITVEFYLDRPFWVVLADEGTLPLFAGAVYKP